MSRIEAVEVRNWREQIEAELTVLGRFPGTPAPVTYTVRRLGDIARGLLARCEQLEQELVSLRAVAREGGAES